MASKSLSKSKFFATKYFAFVIALIVFGLFLLMGPKTPIYSFLFEGLENKVVDTHFRWQEQRSQNEVQQGAVVVNQDLKINPDILILGVDNRSLNDFGAWPWPRYRHADLLNTLTRIQQQNTREDLVFLDFFFVEPSSDAVSDSLLSDAIMNNGNVLLQPVLTGEPNSPFLEDVYGPRRDYLFDDIGTINNVNGDWLHTYLYQGMEPPLLPLEEGIAGYGYPNTIGDSTDKVIRRQPLVLRASRELAVYDLDQFVAGYRDVLPENGDFFRLSWDDKDNSEGKIYSEPIYDAQGKLLLDDKKINEIAQKVRATAPPVLWDSTGDGENDSVAYDISVWEDRFIPSIALAMAIQYLNINWDDVTVNLGDSIILPNPRKYNPDSGQLEKYKIMTSQAVTDPEDPSKIIEPAQYREFDEIRIPIDDKGSMRINFMGARSSSVPGEPQTFPVRSYSSYARMATGPDPDTWPRTLRLENKIIMGGAFSAGMADDEKVTSVGNMYGIEMHANALNTILMNNFLVDLSRPYELLLYAGLLLLIALYTGRLNSFISLGLTLVLVVGLLIFGDMMFNLKNTVIPFVQPSSAMLLMFLSVIIFRGLTEEREKRRVQGMFGQYVSPKVVEEIVNANSAPELGGIDKELTVMFSDIRGFTTLSEKMAPQELVNHLNLYLTAMTDIIMDYKGTLDKYVGDEIMCFWGAPVSQRNHAILSCQAAVRQMEKLRELNEGWPLDRRIDIGIGINSGIMTVGNMGSSGRMNYTLMGDNVNLGARLEGINKEYFGKEWRDKDGSKHIGSGSKIIISEYTYGLVKDLVVARELDNIRVKGKNKPVVIYELIDILVGMDPYLPAPEPQGKGKG